MATAAQIAANRSNSAFCTGPKTDAGKERSSENALKHGLYSARTVLPSENQADFEALVRDVEESCNPANVVERLLARDVAETYWRLQRAKRIETDILAAHSNTDEELAGYVSADRSGQHDRVVRHIDRLQRAWHRALETLRRSQSERRRAEQHAAVQRLHEATAHCQSKMAEHYDTMRQVRQDIHRRYAAADRIGFVPSRQSGSTSACAPSNRDRKEAATSSMPPPRIPALTGNEPAEWRL